MRQSAYYQALVAEEISGPALNEAVRDVVLAHRRNGRIATRTATRNTKCQQPRR
jgi:hypothetical protein